MFDEILKELSKLDKGLEMTVDVPTDEDGYFDRQCPGEPCGAELHIAPCGRTLGTSTLASGAGPWRA